ncbi:MAG: hypothetical protein J2P21_31425 [Chloracidobacterium sp.]|nr:hypothetical protein [Chloracidobacterium sp.]
MIGAVYDLVRLQGGGLSREVRLCARLMWSGWPAFRSPLRAPRHPRRKVYFGVIHAVLLTLQKKYKLCLAFADGATKGVPQAVQVADRFHLIKNLVYSFENLRGAIHLLHKRLRWKSAHAGSRK